MECRGLKPNEVSPRAQSSSRFNRSRSLSARGVKFTAKGGGNTFASSVCVRSSGSMGRVRSSVALNAQSVSAVLMKRELVETRSR